jgi:hypothetical protein
MNYLSDATYVLTRIYSRQSYFLPDFDTELMRVVDVSVRNKIWIPIEVAGGT